MFSDLKLTPLGDMFPDYASLKALIEPRSETGALLVRHNHIASIRDEFNAQYDGKSAICLPDRIIEAIGQFVIDQEAGLEEQGLLPGEGLRKRIEAHAADLIHKVENMKAESSEMDYHEGIYYRNDLADAFKGFRDKCLTAHDFLSLNAYSTRQVPIELRRAYTGYKIELLPVLAKIIDDLDGVDKVYNVYHRVLYPERPAFF